MKIYNHVSHEEYKRAQTKTNKEKLKETFAEQREIEKLSDYIKSNIKDLKFGICHGVRNGFEVKEFREHLGIEIIGTEISDTANQFENVIQWDFHDVKDNWIDNVSFIYSNAFCYSRWPNRCLDKWMSCIKDDGFCIIQWTWHHGLGRKIDSAHCFAASKEEYNKMFEQKYKVKDILSFEIDKTKKVGECYWFIITHK